MRNRVLSLVLTSVLLSLCISTSAQQPQDSALSVHPFFNRAIYDETASPEEIIHNNPDLIQFNEKGTLVLHGKEVHQMVVNGKVIYSEDDTITDPVRLLTEINRRIFTYEDSRKVRTIDDSLSQITLPVSLPEGETIESFMLKHDVHRDEEGNYILNSLGLKQKLSAKELESYLGYMAVKDSISRSIQQNK